MTPEADAPAAPRPNGAAAAAAAASGAAGPSATSGYVLWQAAHREGPQLHLSGARVFRSGSEAKLLGAAKRSGGGDVGGSSGLRGSMGLQASGSRSCCYCCRSMAAIAACCACCFEACVLPGLLSGLCNALTASAPGPAACPFAGRGRVDPAAGLAGADAGWAALHRVRGGAPLKPGTLQRLRPGRRTPAACLERVVGLYFGGAGD